MDLFSPDFFGAFNRSLFSFFRLTKRGLDFFNPYLLLLCGCSSGWDSFTTPGFSECWFSLCNSSSRGDRNVVGRRVDGITRFYWVGVGKVGHVGTFSFHYRRLWSLQRFSQHCGEWHHLETNQEGER